MSEEIPKVEPIDIPEYKYKNSKFDMMPKLPARMLCVASSTGGKTVLIQNLILKIYRGSFERVYIFSPSVHVDDTWSAVKRYIRDVMKVDAEKEQLYYEEYDPVALKKIIDTQHKVIDFQKKNKQKDLFSILLVVDGFADDPKFARYSSLLHGLRFIHDNAISCILSTQKYNALAPIIRLNASALFIFRLKNMNEVNKLKLQLQQCRSVNLKHGHFSFFFFNASTLFSSCSIFLINLSSLLEKNLFLIFLYFLF